MDTYTDSADNNRPYVNFSDAKQFVLTALRERHGPTAIARRPIPSAVTGEPLGIGNEYTPADPVAAVVATQQLYGAARRLLLEHATAARAAGSSWDDLGAVLNLHDDDHGRGYAAFDYIAPPAERWVSRSVRWRCHSCGQRVRDEEPWDHDPDNNEHGHAPDCSRHNAEIDAYLERVRADDGRTDVTGTDDPERS